VTVLAAVLLPGSARAQAHLQLLGGVTSAGDVEPFFAGALGVRMSAIEIDVEAGHFNDVLSKGILDGLNDLQRERGLPVQGIASVPAEYVLGSLRIIPAAGPFRPFITGGIGAARLRPRIDVVIEGISFGDVFGLTSLEPQIEPMAVAGAGLRIQGGKVHVEAAYRYVAIFSDFRSLNLSGSAEPTHVNSVYGALGVGF
jgi:hypothetical protein